MDIAGRDYQPYILGHAPLSGHMVDHVSNYHPTFIDIFDPTALTFYQLVNAGNNLAFGGLGMPAWVQLDCCTLPSAMIGFATTREQIPPDLWEKLLERISVQFGPEATAKARDWTGLVPVSEYCAAATPTPGTVVGFSFYGLIPSVGLGIRTKALALKAYGCTHQIGLTQYDNPSIRAHASLSPVAILHPQAWPHSRSKDTFVYQLTPGDNLDSLISDGQPPRLQPPDDALLIPVNAETPMQIQHLSDTHGALAIVRPGLIPAKGDKPAQLVVRPI